jgi:2-epi-5-epi-valiolone synthase
VSGRAWDDRAASRPENPSMSWQVPVRTSTHYEVTTVDGIFDSDDTTLLAGGTAPGRRLVLLDSGVPQVWRDRVVAHFSRYGVRAHVVVVPGGERCKEGRVLWQILDELRRFGLDRRNEPVIVIGGGAVLDLGGFAASIYRRGVPYLRVPTTLLAYVDASVGIKTGINLAGSKNLVGAFWPPIGVVLDRSFFTSLSDAQLSSGLGEVLKLGVGTDRLTFDLLDCYADRVMRERFQDRDGAELLSRSVQVMLHELAGNLYEDELCRSVDLGHTFSQPFEMRHDPLPHGYAVAVDVFISCVLANERGLFTDAELARVLSVMQRLRMPLVPGRLAFEDMWDSLLDRVQHRGGFQRVPLPERIGSCVFVNDVSPHELGDTVTRVCSFAFAEAEWADDAV